MDSGIYQNKELARIFRQMADCYRYLGPSERFRAVAYDTASKTLSNMTEPVSALATERKKLEDLKGIGHRIAEKIIEYLNTGKISAFEKLKKKVPFALLDLMEIEGIGPATLHILHDQLHIQSKEQLINALEEGRLSKVPGLAEKKIVNLKKGLKLASVKKRLPWKLAEQTGMQLLNEIKKIPGVQQAVLAGSIRRKMDTVGDIDIVITAEHRFWKKIINQIIQWPRVEKILAAGQTKASILISPHAIQVDIRIVTEEDFGAALLYFTGNKEHTIHLRTLAKQNGWKMNEYGVFDEKTGKRLAGNTEEEIYALFGYSYIPPEKRQGKDEFSAAALSIRPAEKKNA